MTKSQVAWARSHDWFRSAFNMPDQFGDNWHVVCETEERDIYTDGTKSEWRMVEGCFDNFEALRAWAGY